MNKDFFISYNSLKHEIISSCLDDLDLVKCKVFSYGLSSPNIRSSYLKALNSCLKVFKIYEFECALKRNDFFTCLAIYNSKYFDDFKMLIDFYIKRGDLLCMN